MANSSVKNLNIDGNVIISGSTTSIDVQQLTTDDNNITLNDVASPTDVNANAGGFTVKGTTDKTFNWLDATDSWTASEHIDVVTGKEYKINTTSVLNATTLGAGIVNSSLTDVGTLTSLQVDLLYLDGSQIGLKTTDEDLITLTNNTVTVAGTVAATQFTGGGAGITGLSTSNIAVPASPGDFLYNNAGAWGGITPPITVALGGTGAANAATARTNLGLGTMAVETATNYLTVANNLSDVTSATAKTNLGLGTANSPTFGGVGTGSVTITATPTSGPAAAPTFSGVVFKSVPVASGSGFKWVIGNEQDGDLAFSHFAINDAGANVGSAVGYLTLDPANTRVIVGQAGGTAVNVVMSGLGYPTADGTANQVLTTDGSAGLTFGTPVTTNITEGTNLYYTNARADARIGAASINALSDVTITTPATNALLQYNGSAWIDAVPTTAHITEGANLYYTDARADARANARIAASSINALSDVTITTPATNAVLQYNGSAWIDATQLTTNVTEGTNLYYTDARADARIALQAGANLDLTGVSTSTLPEGTNLYYTNARADARIVNAGSANWNTAYTDTNAATDANTNSTIVKRGATGNFTASKITADNGIILGNMPGTATGGIQWTGTDFHGYNGSAWVSLTSAATAQISGAVATFTTSPTVTSTSYADIAGYTTSITVTDSNIINVQANVDLSGSGTTVYNIKLVRVISGTPTDLYIDEGGGATIPNIHLNATYADVHGQSNGTVITYKLMAKVDAGTLTVNPDGTNAQIFVQEMTTTPTTVASVNGASGVVVLTTTNIAEGTNLYYTNARARAAISESSTQLAYNSSTGVLTFTQGDTDTVAEGSSNLYYTTARWDTKMTAADTDDLSEGSTNLYHQDDLGSVA